jgi:lipopolysaccharide biosynthesis protein
MKKTIISHFFYPDVSMKLLEILEGIDDDETIFFVNIQGDSTEHKLLYNEVRERLKRVHIIKTPNRGRDIGAKLCLIALSLELNIDSDITLIVHDKKSPHSTYGNSWRDELFKIVSPRYLKKVERIFASEANTGIIGSARYIQNEYLGKPGLFASNSSIQIQAQLKKYKLETSDYDFIAGNIFWIRTALLKSFFEARNILEIRADLEAGNALDFSKGTNIHSWERIMSWIATSKGYKIYGI